MKQGYRKHSKIKRVVRQKKLINQADEKRKMREWLDKHQKQGY